MATPKAAPRAMASKTGHDQPAAAMTSPQPSAAVRQPRTLRGLPLISAVTVRSYFG